MQRTLHRVCQVLFAEAVSSLQSHEHCDGLLPHLSIFGTQRLSAQRRQPRHAQSRASTKFLRRAGLLTSLQGTLSAPSCGVLAGLRPLARAELRYPDVTSAVTTPTHARALDACIIHLSARRAHALAR